MAQTAVVALSRGGAELARKLADAWPERADLFLEQRFLHPGDQANGFDLPLRPVLGRIYAEYSAIVVFLPVGATVRLIASQLQDKRQDPAVVSVDDSGRFAVSLVSGHIGGADRLAQQVADILGATPVITSASHAAGTLAVDLLGREFGWTVETDPITLTRASAAVVNGDPVGVFQAGGETNWWPDETPLPNNIIVYGSVESMAASDCVAALVITDLLEPFAGESDQTRRMLEGKRVVFYRPKSLVAGMGCRRGVPLEQLEDLLMETFKENNLSVSSLGCIATADLKQDEVGLLALADKYGVSLVCYTVEELNAVFETIQETSDAGMTRSDKAHSLLGVWGVSEPAALLASGADKLLVSKRKSDRATVAVTRKDLAS